MPLPTIVTPTYELELPSTGKPIKYRPFLVKEEKLLVLALETEDTKEISNAIKTVLKNCIQTKSIKVETLPTFDIEYLFLNIRGKSVGEQIEVNLIAPDDGETSVSVSIDIDDIKVQRSEEHTNKIKLDDNLMMEMKYPSLDQFIKSNFDFSGDVGLDQSFDFLSCWRWWWWKARYGSGRWDKTRKSWPTVPRVCVDGVDLLKTEIDEALFAGCRHALTNRLDLMNGRAQLMDAWRQIAVSANALQWVMNVEYSLLGTSPAKRSMMAADKPLIDIALL